MVQCGSVRVSRLSRLPGDHWETQGSHPDPPQHYQQCLLLWHPLGIFLEGELFRNHRFNVSDIDKIVGSLGAGYGLVVVWLRWTPGINVVCLNPPNVRSLPVNTPEQDAQNTRAVKLI